MVVVNINIDRLYEKYAELGVIYGTLDSKTYSSNFITTKLNSFEFSPGGTTDALHLAFTDALKECMQFSSEQAFRATSVYDVYLPYSLKEEVTKVFGSTTSTTRHLDGVLDIQPPIYVAELQINGSAFGGFVNNTQLAEDDNKPFPTIQDVLSSYNEHLGQIVSWEDKTGSGTPTFTGTLIQDKHEYALTLTQTNYSSSNTYPDTGDGHFGYAQESDTYYLATFNLTMVQGDQVAFTVTYTDGVENVVIFPDQVSVNATVPKFDGNTAREGYSFEGWTIQGGDGTIYTNDTQVGMAVDRDIVFTAVYYPFAVRFHANIPGTSEENIFRIYYPTAVLKPDGTYHLNSDNSVPVFYDIPDLGDAHNDYVFKGWYNGKGSDATPIDWDICYTADQDIYAHWLEVGTVAQAETDRKVLPESWNKTYQGYDLVGVQLRKDVPDDGEHYGEAGAGIRFITVLSQGLYDQLNAIAGNESGAEYGLVLARADSIPSGVQQLQYKGTDVNGVDTTTDFSFAVNLKCNGVTDHYTGTDADGNMTYRLYTGVVTYKKAAAQGEEALQAAYASNMVARAYIRYYDGNGLLRTYYNNYSGTQTLQGCSVSYNKALEMLQTP